MITQKGLLNLVTWHNKTFNVTALDRASLLARFSFDAAGWEIWPYLVAGATLFPYQPNGADKWADFLQKNKITIAFIPTPLLESKTFTLESNHASLRVVLTGGDRLMDRYTETRSWQLFNNYGPTENTVVATSMLVKDTDSSLPAIGRPIANTQIHILDSNLQPLPIGVSGELHIAGAGLARGYLNRPQLTAERFIPNPFSNDPYAHLYKTGDLARWQPNGHLEYLGRSDHQIKLRGFRIELGEIETRLHQHPAIQKVVVTLHKEAGHKQLVAYYTAKQTDLELHTWLGEILPDYMIPAHFIPLQQWPLTPTGKIDRKALPAPITKTDGKEYLAPYTNQERILATVWSQVLHHKPIGLYDNFFQLGGDSILAIQIVATAKIAGIQLTPKAIFRHPVFADQARVAQPVSGLEANQKPVVGEVPLLPIQHTFFAWNLPKPQYFN